MPDLVMPRLSDSMEEGVVLSWLKSEGDQVAVGEELVEIETDKANMTYESDLEGTLVQVLAGEGDTVPVGGPIAIVGEEGERRESEGAAGEGAAGGAGEEPAAVDDSGHTQEGSQRQGGGRAQDSALTAPAEQPGQAAQGNGGRVRASPVARRIARDRGVDVAALEGSGPGGRVIRKDVEEAPAPASASGTGEQAPAGTAATDAHAPAGTSGAGAQAPVGTSGTGPPSAKGEPEVREPARLQQTIARRMAESKAVAPHFYLTTEVDMTACVEARSRLKQQAAEGAVTPSFNDMVVKASALALREHSKANGAYRDGNFEVYPRINVGVAVAADEALVVPTVFDADTKGLAAIAADVRELAAKVRDGSVTPPELSGATFTVSNLGMYGITEFDAVINLPQAAILAVGAIVERPVARQGEVTTAQMMSMTLSCDHRILYGHEGAEFLARIRQLLEEPLSLAL